MLLGAYDMSPMLHSIVTTEATDAADTTGFQQTDKTYVTGINDTKVNMQGRFEGVVGTVDRYIRDQVQAQVNAPFVVGFGSIGLKPGQGVIFGEIDYTQFAVTAPMDGLVALTGDAICTGGVADGILLAGGATIVSDTTTASEHFPLGAAGWAAAVSLTSNTWTGTVSTQIQSSPDGGAWTPLGAPIVLPGGQPGSAFTSGPTTPDTYFRAVITLGSGTGQVVPAVAFGRI